MRGVITLSFDDGYESVFRHVAPWLTAEHIPAVFAVPLETKHLEQETGQRLTPWPEWLPFRSAGHELAAHGVSHTSLTQLSGEALKEELRRPAEQLSATTLVYPGGAYSEDVIREAKKVYAAARTTRYGFESRPPRDPWQLCTVDYTRANWSLAKANLRALWAVLTNRWLIETYHLVYPTLDGVDSPESALHHSVPFADFKKHVEFIKTVPIAIQTIHETIGHRHNQE